MTAPRDPQTGRAMPERIPARQSVPSRAECWAVGVVVGCIGGVSLYAITHLVTGGVL